MVLMLTVAGSTAYADSKPKQADERKEREAARKIQPVMPPPSVPIGPMMTRREFFKSRLQQQSIEEEREISS